MTPAQKARMLVHLKTAAAELGKATQYLNAKEDACPTCHLNVRQDQVEWKSNVELTAARAKVLKQIEILQDASTK